VSEVGFFVGIACIGLQIYLWKTRGPGKILKSIIGYFKPQATEEDVANIGATAEAVEGVEVSGMSAVEILSGVLNVIAALLLIIGTILEIVQLEKQLDKIDEAKANFNKEYENLVRQIQKIGEASEKFRRHNV